MAKLNRIPTQVSQTFKARLNELQKKIMLAQGKKKSFTDITTEISLDPLFNEIEKNIIKSENKSIDLRIRFDRRMLE